MSNVRYVRTKSNFEDEEHLPANEHHNDEIEMDDLSSPNVPTTSSNTGSSTPVSTYKAAKKTRCYLLWAIITTILLLALIIISIAAHPRRRDVNWCCIGARELAKCKNMSKYFEVYGFAPDIACKESDSVDGCVKLVDTDKADLFSMNNLDLFKHKDILMPVMAEEYKDDDSGVAELGFFYVAVARQSDQGAALSLKSLKTRKACIANSAMAKGVIGSISPKCSAGNLLDGVFSSVCAPDLNTNKFCSGCKSGTCPSTCSADQYCGSDGALRCLVESSTPTVAFLSHKALENALKLPSTSFNSSEYQLLCSNGSRAELTSHGSCHLAWMPTRSLVISGKIRSGDDIDIPVDIVELLHVAQLYFGSHSTEKFNMFKTPGGKNLLFHDSAHKLIPLLDNCTAESYLGESFLRSQYSATCQKYSARNLTTCYFPQYGANIPAMRLRR